jgi:hypothetical protein
MFHGRHPRLCQEEKSAVAEHSTESDHRFKLRATEVRAKNLDRPVTEAAELGLHRDNVNREEAFKPSKSSNYSTILSRNCDCRLSAKLVPTIVGRGCHVVSVTDPLRP